MNNLGIKLPFSFPGLIENHQAKDIGSAHFTISHVYSGSSFMGSLKDAQGTNGDFFYNREIKALIPEWPEWNEEVEKGGLVLTPSYLDLCPPTFDGGIPNPRYIGNAVTYKEGSEYTVVKNMRWFENGVPIIIEPKNELFAIDSDTRALIIKGNRWEDNTINGKLYPKIESQHITYSVKFDFYDPLRKEDNNPVGIEVLLSHTIKYVQDGENMEYVLLQAVPDQFANAPLEETLDIEAVIMIGGSKQTDLSNVDRVYWEYYDPEHVTNDHWVEIPIVEGTDATDLKLTVSCHEISKAKTFRYTAVIKGELRSDTIVIRRDQSPVRISIKSDAGNRFKSFESDRVEKKLQAEILVNNKGNWGIVEPTDLRMMDFYLTWRRLDQYGQDIPGEGWPKQGLGLHEITIDKREIGKYTTVVLELQEEYANRLWYGVSRDRNSASPDFERIGLKHYHKTLPIHRAIKPCIAGVDGKIKYWLNPNDITKKEDGTPADLSGADGQACIYFPATYSIIHGRGSDNTKDTIAVSYSPFTLDSDVAEYFPEFLVTMDYVTKNATDNTLICCYNESEEFKGEAIGTCKTNLSYYEAITGAKNYGSTWTPSFYHAEQLITALMVIEYGSYDLTKPYNPTKTSEGFTQGGIGIGASNWTSEEWKSYNGKQPLHKILEIQKHISQIDGTLGTYAYSKELSANGVSKSVQFNCWRWLSNPWGHIRKAVVGANVKYNAARDITELFITKAPNSITTPFVFNTNYIYAGEVPKTPGYISEYLKGSFAPYSVDTTSSAAGRGYWNAEGDYKRGSYYMTLGTNLDDWRIPSRTTTDLLFSSLYQSALPAKTVENFSTGLFTVIKK